jgi:RimJ/RimL family protein N-acetyltransferase
MSPGVSHMSFNLETERLTLRLRTEADAAWNLRLLAEHTGGTAVTLPEARQRLANQKIASHTSGIGFLTISRRKDGQVLGYCGLFVGGSSLDEPELAYELLAEFHGNGYATEAARAVVDAAFATGRHRLWSTVRAWNAPSSRVLAKLGFHHDHSITDDRGELLVLVLDKENHTKNAVVSERA